MQTINFEQVQEDEHKYLNQDWYQTTKQLDKDYWSEPYFDTGVGDILMTTFSKLLKDSNGRVIGVITADVSLTWFSDMVLANKPYEDSYTFMLSRKAYYLVHREQDRVLNHTFFTATVDMDDPEVPLIGQDMLGMHRGYRLFSNDGVISYAFYEPIERIGWSVSVVSTQKSVMAEFNKMTAIIWIVAIIGLLLIFFFTFVVIRGLSKPLKIISSSASIIAQGNFDVSLPDIKGRDEMYELHKSFVNMQSSLKNYIAELKRTTSARERIESELAVANKIQMGMLPKVFPPFPNHPNIDLFAKLTPAKEVGGDLYDFFIKDDKLFFAVGDASGKGVPASLLMAVTSSLFRSIASHINEPNEIMEALNNSISEGNDANMFITLFIGVLDISTGAMEFANAGHNPPLLLSNNGTVEFIKTEANIALGVFGGRVFKKQSITINKGDSIFLYSDGLTEAENSAKELYSEQRLIETLKAIPINSNPRTAINGIDISIADFVQGNEQSDDLTMMMINFK